MMESLHKVLVNTINLFAGCSHLKKKHNQTFIVWQKMFSFPFIIFSPDSLRVSITMDKHFCKIPQSTWF